LFSQPPPPCSYISFIAPLPETALHPYLQVDKNLENIKNLNKRLKKTLESVRKGDKIVVDLILMIVIIGIAAYIYQKVK
jgi:hypothetical protein